MVELSIAVAQFLAPLLPYLLKAGSAAADEAGRRAAGQGWETARKLWARLGPGLRGTAARDLAPTLERLLAADPALARDVLGLAEREPSIVVGGTGNVVKHGTYNVDIGTATGVQFGDRYYD